MCSPDIQRPIARSVLAPLRRATIHYQDPSGREHAVGAVIDPRTGEMVAGAAPAGARNVRVVETETFMGTIPNPEFVRMQEEARQSRQQPPPPMTPVYEPPKPTAPAVGKKDGNQPTRSFGAAGRSALVIPVTLGGVTRGSGLSIPQ